LLFYLAPSVAKAALANERESIDFLRRILDSRKRGRLLIHASMNTYNALLSFFSQGNDENEKEVIKYLIKRTREKKGIIRDLTRFVYVSTLPNEVSTKYKKILLISPKLANQTNILYPPIMLGENITDCKFYVNAIAEHFKVKLPNSLTSLQISNHRFVGGGGNTTSNQYAEEKKKALDLCYCIVDSDQNCEKDSIGDTAKYVIEVDKFDKSPLCDYLVIEAYSAENLLPIKAIRDQFIVGKSQEEIKEFEHIELIRSKNSWKYLPLKKGLKAKDFRTTKAFSTFWKKELLEMGKNFPCCQIENCECIYIPSINSKTLENAVKNQTSWISELQQETNTCVADTYRLIACEIRSWFCVGSAIRS